MKSKILKSLRETEGYVSGQQLCEEFSVSRTAIWKVINQLKEEGYKVEAVRNKGYRIIESPDIMTKEEIASLLETSWAGKDIRYYDEIDSTNIKARQLGEEGGGHGLLVAADHQNGGKGRRGRSWLSPKHQNIYMTILLRPQFTPDQASMLTLVMAYSVARAVITETGLTAGIKWPNDVVVNGRKICGILTEMSAEVDYINYVVIGVGINVNMSVIPEDLEDKATSIQIEKGAAIKRSALIAAVLAQFEHNYETFVRDQGLGGLYQQYNDLLVNCGQEVKVLEPGSEYTGRARGINETGELLVERADRTTERVFAGEVSVRGIYGYI